MNVPREQVSIALFNLISPAYPWKTAQRAGMMWQDVGSVGQPAMFVFQIGESGTQAQAIGLTKWRLHFWCMIYLRADAAQISQQTTIETQMNDILDKIEKALQPIRGEKQTLGGIVNNAWIEGQIIIDTGILDQQCALIIPVMVETGV